MLFAVDDAAELQAVIADIIFDDERKLRSGKCKLYE